VEPLRSTPAATLYARVKNKRYTLAVRRLKDGDTASVLAEFFGVLDGLDAGVKAVYLDRGFYDGKCLHAASGAQLRVRDPDHPVG